MVNCCSLRLWPCTLVLLTLKRLKRRRQNRCRPKYPFPNIHSQISILKYPLSNIHSQISILKYPFSNIHSQISTLKYPFTNIHWQNRCCPKYPPSTPRASSGCFSLCHFGDRSLYIRSKQGPEPQVQISYEGSYKE